MDRLSNNPALPRILEYLEPPATTICMRLNRRFNDVVMNNLTKLKQRAARICISSRIIPEHQNDPIGFPRLIGNSVLVQCELYPFDKKSLSLEIEIKEYSVVASKMTAKAYKFLLALQKYQFSQRKNESRIYSSEKKFILEAKTVLFIENMKDALYCIFSHVQLERFEMRDSNSDPLNCSRFSDEQLALIQHSILEQSTTTRKLNETCVVVNLCSDINEDIIRAIGSYRCECKAPWSLLNSDVLLRLPTASARLTTIISVVDGLLPPAGLASILTEWLQDQRKINELRLEFETRLNAWQVIDVFVANFPGIQESMRNETGLEASLIRPSDGKLMKISLAPGCYKFQCDEHIL